jgi:hypothetical protein
MLSIANVSSSSQAASYYEQADDYYTADRSPSQWSGQAAAELGLEGAVKPEDFRHMLDGTLPNGEQLHNAAAGRRGGTCACSPRTKPPSPARSTMPKPSQPAASPPTA